MLDRPNEPVSDATYFDCMDTIMEKSKLLGEAGALLTTHAKQGEYEEFGKAVDNTSEAVCQLTESAAQVCLSVCVFAYLSISLCLSLCLFVCLSVCQLTESAMQACLFICMYVCKCICLSVRLSVV